MSVVRLGRRVAELKFTGIKSKAKQLGKVRLVSDEVEAASSNELIKIGSGLIAEDKGLVVVLGSGDDMARVIVMAGEDAVNAGVNCGEMAAEAARIIGGGGGGRPDMGQGGGPKADFIVAALKRAKEICVKQLGQETTKS